jgi:hypothetical protein
LLGGVAVDSGEVAELVCRLEDSPYFCLVCPSFSRNRGFKTGNNSERNNPNSKNGVSAGEGNFQTSEFEIGCYLANYRQQGPGLAKQMQNQKP